MAQTLPTAQPPRDKSLGEAQYLQEQAANAKAAIKNAVSDLGQQIGAGIDPKEWTREHPWTTMGAAAAAGFLCAAVFVPSREQSALKRLAAIERALSDEPTNGESTTTSTDSSGGKKVVKKGMFSNVLGELVKSMGPALASSLTAGIAAKGAGAQNGSTPPRSPTAK
jgi:hypothetical protein